MISLNLLPRERKEMFIWRVRTKSVIFWGSKVLCLLVIFCVPFFVINFYLNTQIIELSGKVFASEQTKEVKQIELLENSSKSINDTLIKINRINENQIYWTNVLSEIIKNIPSDIQIFSLEVSPDSTAGGTLAASKGKFTLIGEAKTRDGILALKKNLKESPSFENIESPLDNLVKRNDVDFKFVGTFILENFKAKKVLEK